MSSVNPGSRSTSRIRRATRLQLMRLRHRDDDVGFADVPFIDVAELPRCGHVGQVPLQRAGVGPLRDGRDFLVGQRRIALEMLDADVAIDVPGRHLAGLHLRLDRSRPRPRVLITDQRHRRDRAGPMAVLAGALEYRGHVFGERHALRRRGRTDGAETQQREQCALHFDSPGRANASNSPE